MAITSTATPAILPITPPTTTGVGGTPSLSDFADDEESPVLSGTIPEPTPVAPATNPPSDAGTVEVNGRLEDIDLEVVMRSGIDREEDEVMEVDEEFENVCVALFRIDNTGQ